MTLDRFLDREAELRALEEAWGDPGPVLSLVWGRRRTGKTRLLGRFVEGKRAVFYGATQQSRETELAGFSEAVRTALAPAGTDLLAHRDFASWESALDYLGERASERRLAVVLDEFPFLVDSEPALPSIVQRFWDHRSRGTKLRLILCGSATTVMEDLQARNAYERAPAAAPQVWQAAFASCAQPHASAAQQLLLGVNAHINFDLVLALVDLLEAEWPQLDDAQRAARFADYSRVNAIIADTIDAVQDTILEPAMPGMELLDTLLGHFDEMLVSRLINSWRQTVWEHAAGLLDAAEPEARARLILQVETNAMRLVRLIS